MATTVRELLSAFESLCPADQHQVAAEILRRTTNSDELPDAAFDELAAELCRGYDAEEAARAQP